VAPPMAADTHGFKFAFGFGQFTVSVYDRSQMMVEQVSQMIPGAIELEAWRVSSSSSICCLSFSTMRGGLDANCVSRGNIREFRDRLRLRQCAPTERGFFTTGCPSRRQCVSIALP